MTSRHREIVRYRNRKLYEKSERRFVTLDDIARAVAGGDRIRVVSADTGEDITAKILSRALASDRVAFPASTDALALLLRAGSDAAETVAGVAERVGAARMAGAVRKAAQPERIAETFAPVTRRVETARHDVERIASPPAIHAEIQEVARRLDHLEALAAASFPKGSSPAPRSEHAARPAPARKKETRKP